MLTLRKDIDVAAPVEDVFAYMDEPHHQVALGPSLVRSDLIERLPNGGARVKYTCRRFGISFSGEVEATDYVPNQRIVWTMNGDFQGTLRWYFAGDGEGRTRTRLTYAATYTVAGPKLVQPLIEPLLHWCHEREIQTLTQRLQNRIESTAAKSM